MFNGLYDFELPIMPNAMPSCYNIPRQSPAIKCHTKTNVNHKHTGADKNGRHFTIEIFKINLYNRNVWLSITISLKLLHRDRTKDMLALAQIMTWRHDLYQWWLNLLTRASLGLNELTWLILQISNRKITPYFVHQFRCMLNLLCRKQHTNFINPEYFNIMILRDYIIKYFMTLTCTYIHSRWIYAFCSNYSKNSRLVCNIWVLCLAVSSRQQASVAPLFIPYAASRDVQGNIFLVISLASERCYNSCYSR